MLYRGQKLALAEFLPLDAENWITSGNALRIDWLSVCPPTGTGVKLVGDDLFQTPLDQAQIDFENEGDETYICGNPPYAGLSSQTKEQKEDLERIFNGITGYWKSFDYVTGWFWKAKKFITGQKAKAAFVATNSICQGQLVSMFWPLIVGSSVKIFFAHSSFKWRNLAANNAGVTVVIVGISSDQERTARLFDTAEDGQISEKAALNINAYIVPGPDVYIDPVSKAPPSRPTMFWGNKPTDGGNLLLTHEQSREIIGEVPQAAEFLRPYFGSFEFIKGIPRVCIWVEDRGKERAYAIPDLASRFGAVEEFRSKSKAKETRPSAKYPHKFRQIQGMPGNSSIIVPIHSSESRPYLPVGLLPAGGIISNAAYGLYDAPLWTLALIGSRLHLIWIATVCGKIKTDFRYSNTLGWNTFPVLILTEKNKSDLTRCAEDILLAREAHFPATIADLYDPDSMPINLREAHDRNDEVLERIYVGRRFRNDTERLEKLFELYTEMTGAQQSVRRIRPGARA